MNSRRTFVTMLASTLLYPLLPFRCAQAKNDVTFESLFAKALAEPELLDATRRVREGLSEQYEYHATKAIAPRRPPSSRRISDDATRLIVLFEVTNKARYQRKFQKPIWPAGKSGITIGVGYDLGYVTQEWLEEDWKNHMGRAELELLRPACGLRGKAAHKELHRFSQIETPWDRAYSQFTQQLLPLYVAETIARLPNAQQLSDDSLGAMVSLVYNRGASFRKDGDRYLEMRNILVHMTHEEYARIPDELRNMKRLWRNMPNMDGLLERRDLEAALFEQGLKAA